MKDSRKKIIKKARRLVVKVGSAVIAGPGSAVSASFLTRLAGEIRGIKEAGKEAVIVSSGAIATGMKRLSLTARPVSIPERQAVAAVGQGALMALYDAAFSKAGEKVAQVLLTHEDFADRRRFLNARNTLFTLFKFGIVPVINENDTVAVDEIKFGDNDALSALTTNLVEADLLVILTDIDGLYDRDPKLHRDAKLVSLVEDADTLDVSAIGGSISHVGTGGMRSKCEAASKAAHYGAATVIADGNSPGILSKILAGEDVGTLFLPREDRLTSRKHWIAFSTRPSGRVFVDDGARDALLNKGKSLLPSGIRDVEGAFEAGEVIHCVDAKGMEFARGVSNYSSDEIKRIMGLKSKDIEKTLGYKVYDEVIHRDNLVVV